MKEVISPKVEKMPLSDLVSGKKYKVHPVNTTNLVLVCTFNKSDNTFTPVSLDAATYLSMGVDFLYYPEVTKIEEYDESKEER